MYLYFAALILTIIAWAFQLYETLIKKTRNINIVLPLAYGIACVLFGIYSFIGGDTLSVILEIVTIILAIVVFIVLAARNK